MPLHSWLFYRLIYDSTLAGQSDDGHAKDKVGGRSTCIHSRFWIPWRFCRCLFIVVCCLQFDLRLLICLRDVQFNKFLPRATLHPNGHARRNRQTIQLWCIRQMVQVWFVFTFCNLYMNIFMPCKCHWMHIVTNNACYVCSSTKFCQERHCTQTEALAEFFRPFNCDVSGKWCRSDFMFIFCTLCINIFMPCKCHWMHIFTNNACYQLIMESSKFTLLSKKYFLLISIYGHIVGVTACKWYQRICWFRRPIRFTLLYAISLYCTTFVHTIIGKLSLIFDQWWFHLTRCSDAGPNHDPPAFRERKVKNQRSMKHDAPKHEFVVPAASEEWYFNPDQKTFLKRPRKILFNSKMREVTLPQCKYSKSLIPGAGNGLHAMEPFSKGDWLSEYGGEILDIPEAKRRKVVKESSHIRGIGPAAGSGVALDGIVNDLRGFTAAWFREHHLMGSAVNAVPKKKHGESHAVWLKRKKGHESNCDYVNVDCFLEGHRYPYDPDQIQGADSERQDGRSKRRVGAHRSGWMPARCFIRATRDGKAGEEFLVKTYGNGYQWE